MSDRLFGARLLRLDCSKKPAGLYRTLPNGPKRRNVA
jgi:hypothetical protein